MPSADEYRRLAAECLELAPKISSDLRAMFIALAQGWVNLADLLDEDYSILPDPPPPADGETPENSNSGRSGRNGDRVE